MPNLKGRSHQILNLLQSIEQNQPLYLLIHSEENSKEVLTCAILNKVERKVAISKFNNEDVRGFIRFTQNSPYEPTQIDMQLDLHEVAFSYGIDVMPTIKRRKQEQKRCPNIRETIFNPFHIDPEEVPNQAEGTTDQYATGDLSGKFGTLANKKKEIINTLDFNLPLFGYFSVIGRAIVIYAPDGPSLGCANIELENLEMTTAYATFDVPLQGQFIMRQPKDQCFTDTYIYIEISRPYNRNYTKTFNHPWSIHTNPVNGGKFNCPSLILEIN